MNTIVLATDGSEYARRATEHALNLAEREDAMLHVLCVVDQRKFNEPALSSAELATIYAEEHAVLCTKEVTEMAQERNIPVHGDVRHGLPHEVILEYAEDVEADLIVIGEHGEHTEHFAGVGKKVTERAECEVAVVTADT